MATQNDKKTSNIWFPFHWNDYSNKTAHLTLLEHGAYLGCMLEYYRTARALPADLNTVYRVLRAITPEEQQAIVTILGEFFEKQVDGTWKHHRIEEELQGIVEKRRRKSESGAKGGSTNSPAQAAYRERGKQNDSSPDSTVIADSIAELSQNDSKTIHNNNTTTTQKKDDETSLNEDQVVVAVVSYLEAKHMADIGPWGDKHKLQMKEWIIQYGEAFMDKAITLAKAEGFDDSVKSRVAIMVTTYLPKAIAQLVAKRAQTEQKKRDDEIQAAAIERDTREIVAKRDRPRTIDGKPASECSADEFFGNE
jgi:uncharacterized protein YdaU (DUF1376 family)